MFIDLFEKVLAWEVPCSGALPYSDNLIPYFAGNVNRKACDAVMARNFDITA